MNQREVRIIFSGAKLTYTDALFIMRMRLLTQMFMVFLELPFCRGDEWIHYRGESLAN